ncbi:MAG: sulfurtransferase [Burkholderiales bacterium]|nr:sulfurtransferase [Burkholderiales bacterium]
MHTTLISAAELATQIHNPNWVILDCRHDLMDTEAGSNAFAAGHLPTAQFAHLDQRLSGPKRGSDGQFLGRHPLPVRTTFIDTLRDWGINDDTQVIAYDAHGGMFAARLWWMLRWVGHSAVAVLDGGLPAWLAAGHSTTTEFAPRARGHIGARPPLVSTVDVYDVMANLNSKNHLVVDARAPDRFRGENETIDPVGGHIPGAKNRFFKDNLQADGCFKSSEQLQQEWLAIVPKGEDAIMQCGSGVTACHNLLALEVANLPGAALFPGSWSQWCSDSSRPVER